MSSSNSSERGVAASGALTRRALLGSAAALAGATCLAEPGPAAMAATRAEPGVVTVPRPRAPYRVWFQPRLFARDVDLYANMTMECGYIDARVAHAMGKTALNWVYGLNHPDAKGPEYWRDACSVAARSWPRRRKNATTRAADGGGGAQPGGATLVSAGISIDEWVPPKLPDNVRWLSEGLRAGKRENPEVFIAVWTTDPTPPLFELGNDGTVDLIIVEGYTHSAAESGPGLSTSWETGLRRCRALMDAGLEAKTIFSFGHVTAKKNARGESFKGAWIRQKAQELKEKFPKMPGVAFYQHHFEDSGDVRELIQACDRISGEFWKS